MSKLMTSRKVSSIEYLLIPPFWVVKLIGIICDFVHIAALCLYSFFMKMLNCIEYSYLN